MQDVPSSNNCWKDDQEKKEIQGELETERLTWIKRLLAFDFVVLLLEAIGL